MTYANCNENDEQIDGIDDVDLEASNIQGQIYDEVPKNSDDKQEPSYDYPFEKLSEVSLSVVDFKNGVITADAMLGKCESTMRRIARVVANKFGNNAIEGAKKNLEDEVCQELAILLWQKISADYNEKIGNVENLMMRYAQRIASNQYDKNMTIGIEMPEMLADGVDMFDGWSSGYQSSHDEMHIPSYDDEIDHRKALAVLTEALKENDELLELESYFAINKQSEYRQKKQQSQQRIQIRREVVAKKKITTIDKESGNKKTKTVLSPDQIELREIMDWLVLSQKEFAVVLGMADHQPRLASYLYGVTSGVDKNVMAHARALRAAGKGKKEKAIEYEAMQMSDIAIGWFAKLGLDHMLDSDINEVAAIVGVARSTIRRWLSNGMRPLIQKILRYETRVLEHVKSPATPETKN